MESFLEEVGLENLGQCKRNRISSNERACTRAWNVILGKKKEAYSVFLHGNSKIYCFGTWALNVKSV